MLSATNGEAVRKIPSVVRLSRLRKRKVFHMADFGPGTRLTCLSCGTQIVVVKPSASALACCGQPMVPLHASSKAADG